MRRLGRPAGRVSARRLEQVGAGAAVLAAAGVLLARIVPDLRGKPLFEDEAVAGLIAVRPLGELLQTVMWDRGGAPLHFVLAHAAYAFSLSPVSLRAVSLVFAVAAVLVCFELGRELDGLAAGAVAALVAGSSTALAIYGTFGRMYSLFAAAGGLATLLFVRAVRRPTGRRVTAAAAGGWLVLAVHPYGILLVGAELAVAAVLWRGRGLRRALPVAVAGLAAAPFFAADLRLAGRFSIGVESGSSLAGGDGAWEQLERALRSFAGGAGVTFWLFVAVAAAGLAVLLRRERAVAALAAVALLVPPVLFVLLRTQGRVGLSPRHLVFTLPLWSAAIGIAVARAARPLPFPLRAACVAGIGVLAALSPPGGLSDPRLVPNVVLGGGPPGAPAGGPRALAGPRAWLERSVRPGAVAFPYSAVYLGALPAMRHALTLPRAESGVIRRTIGHASLPIPAVYLAVPATGTEFDLAALRRRLGDRYRVARFRSWLLVEGRGAFLSRHTALRVLWRELVETRRARIGAAPAEVRGFFAVSLREVYAAMRSLEPPPRRARAAGGSPLPPSGPPPSRGSPSRRR